MAVAALLAGCGEDAEPSGPVAPVREPPGGERDAATPRSGAGGGDPAPGAEADSPPRGREPSAPPPTTPASCLFRAPEGRLAEAEVTIALDGVVCEEAVPLAKAAALGQPAGANLTLTRDGFRCTPSTAQKGVNVTYTCIRGPEAASFEVLWTASGG